MTEHSTLKEYISLLSKMRRANVRGYQAPHKILLLMTIIKLIEAGKIVDNHIVLNKDLEQEFSKLWKKMIDNEEDVQMDYVAEELFHGQQKVYPFKCNIANPYYHLSGEPFWTLEKSESWKEQSSWSLSQLRKGYEYAILDEELFELMKQPERREILFQHLEEMLKN